MSRVVDFLEKMGSDARLRHASEDDVELALAEARVDSPMSNAILARNAEAVRALLGQVKMGKIQQTPTPSPAPAPEELPRPSPVPEPDKEGEDMPSSKDSSPTRSRASQ
jgi:hypothetical protein